MDATRATADIVAGGRRLGARGLISAGEGNLSIRLDTERLLITPSGRRKDELEPGDLVVVRIGHAEREARSASGLAPSSDLAIHLAVHAARPDIGAVVHAHLPASMALTLAGEVPDPAALPETAFHLPRLPFVPFGEMGSDELAERIAAALSEGPEPLPGCGGPGTSRRRRGRAGCHDSRRPARAHRGPVSDLPRRPVASGGPRRTRLTG